MMASIAWRPSGALLPLLGMLVAVDLAFVAVNAASILVIEGVPNWLFMGAESNLPTWWSSMKLFLTGTCFLIVALRIRHRGAAALWMALFGLAFVTMSADEVALLHEMVGFVLDGATRAGTTFHHTGLWFVVVGVPFLLVVAVILRKLWLELGAVPGTRARLVLGLAALLAGALVIEGLSNFTFAPGELRSNVVARHIYFLSVVLEEGLEMIGGSLLLWGAAVFMVHHPSLPGLADLARPAPEYRAAEAGAPADDAANV